MKHTAIALMLTLALAPASLGQDAPPPNLVANPSFEEAKGDQVAAWRISDELSAFTAEQVRTGKTSVKIVDESPKLGSSVSSGLVPVEPGKKYTIGVWGYSVVGKGLGIYVRCFTKNRKAIPTGPARYHKMASPRRRRWRRTAFVMTTPPDCGFISIWLHSYSGAIVTAYIDDVFVWEGAHVKETAKSEPKPFDKAPIRFYDGDHPYLLVTPADIAEIKRKAEEIGRAHV